MIYADFVPAIGLRYGGKMTDVIYGKVTKRFISVITAVGFLSLVTVQPVVGFETDGLDMAFKTPIVGIGFSGSLDFKNLSISGFSYTPVDGLHGQFSDRDNLIFGIRDGQVKIDLPLVTFGEDIKYPGVFYNHNGTQLYQHILYSYEGREDSQAIIWPYIVGGALVFGGVIAMAASSSSSGGSNDDNSLEASSTDDTLTDEEIQDPVDQVDSPIEEEEVLEEGNDEFNNLPEAEK